ncbi:MAG: hypothetical protein EAX90_15320 [Candidatus Heimdallarchaeota archaeon]|nr:hypothetical protein [Candidatus Heimdallarchaeota archaeon]
MKIYSYVLRNDQGFAPNPFWDYCTLALDQPLIRQVAQIGDWIVGLKENLGNSIKLSLLFAMKITEKLTFEEYWNDPRFQLKKPDFSIDEQIFRVGDNIYSSLNEDTEQLYSLHSNEFFENDEEWLHQKKQDLQGKFVLIADKNSFHYFGRKTEKIPSEELIDILYCDIGHKCIADPIVPEQFIDFIDNLRDRKKVGFITSPEKWPKDDDSWKQCEISK